MTALAGRKALVRVTGAPVVMINEPMTADVTKKIYTVTNAARNCWDPFAPLTVEVAGATVTSGFTVERLVGRITFAASQGASAVTVSGEYLPLSTAAGCHQFSLSRDGALIDVSEFGDSWKESIAGMLGASGSLSKWFQSDTYFFDAMDAGSPVVLEFFANSAAAFTARAWTTITKDSLSASVESAIDEAIDWSGGSDADSNTVALA